MVFNVSCILKFTAVPTHPNYPTHGPFNWGQTGNNVWLCLIALILNFIFPISKDESEHFLMWSFILIIVYKQKQKQKQWFQHTALPVTK